MLTTNYNGYILLQFNCSFLQFFPLIIILTTIIPGCNHPWYPGDDAMNNTTYIQHAYTKIRDLSLTVAMQHEFETCLIRRCDGIITKVTSFGRGGSDLQQMATI